MSNQFDVRVDETVHRNGDRIVEVNYVYQETRNSDVREYRVAVKRQDYERMTRKMNKAALSFDSFAKV